MNFENVNYVLSPDCNLYMDIQQTINLQIFRRFTDEGIEFAFPSQSLIVQTDSRGPDILAATVPEGDYQLIPRAAMLLVEILFV